MNQKRFGKDDPVWITRLGPTYGEKRFRGEIVGVSVDEQGPFPAIYIVRVIDPFDPNSEFDFATITGACLDKREEQ